MIRSTPRCQKEAVQGLMAEEILPQVHYIRIYSAVLPGTVQRGDFPAAEWHYAHSISLPLFPAMTDQEQDRVVDCVEKILVKSEA